MTFKFIQIELEAELTHTGRQQRMKLGQMTRKLTPYFVFLKIAFSCLLAPIKACQM